MRFQWVGLFLMVGCGAWASTDVRFTCPKALSEPQSAVLHHLFYGPPSRKPGWDIALNEAGQPFYKGQPFQSLAATLEPQIESFYFHSNRGLVPAQSQLQVSVFAGTAADYSHAGSVLSLLNILTTEMTRKIFRKLKEDPNYLPVAAYSFDLPHSGANYSSRSFDKLETLLPWMETGMMIPRRLAPELKHVSIGRSASPRLIGAVASRQRELLSGMIWTAPMHTSDLDVSIEAVETLAGANKFTINREAFDWINGIFRVPVLQWNVGNAPETNIPILILVGSEDNEERVVEGRKIGWREYRLWEQLNPKMFRFIVIPGAGHDVYSTKNSEALQHAMRVTYRFFQFVLRGETDLSRAFPPDS